MNGDWFERFQIEHDITHLYRAYDAAGALLYIGITGDVRARMASHRTTSEWYGRVDRVETETFATRREALDAECDAILDESPEFNRQPLARRVEIVKRKTPEQAFLAGVIYAAGPRRAVEILRELAPVDLKRLATAAS